MNAPGNPGEAVADGPTPTGGGAAEADVHELMRMIWHLVRRTRRPAELIPERLRPLLDSSGLAQRHVAPLISIAMNGSLPVGQLARHLGLNPATASQLVTELARAGLVLRSGDGDDRRRTIASVHPDHRAAIVPMVERQLEPLRQALNAQSGVEREHFLRGLRLLVTALESYH